jgi:hypothetical protein
MTPCGVTGCPNPRKSDEDPMCRDHGLICSIQGQIDVVKSEQVRRRLCGERAVVRNRLRAKGAPVPVVEDGGGR